MSPSRPVRRHVERYERRPSAERTASASGVDRRERATVARPTGCGRAPVTTRTTREPGSISPRRDRLDERAERGAARAVGLDAGRLGEQRGVRPRSRRSATATMRAAGRARGADREVAVRRVADRERRERRVAASTREMPPVVGEGVGDRARALRLGGEQPGHRLVGEPRARQLGEALRELREQRAARGGADDGVGQLPAELLGDLERDRLRALARVRVQVPAHEAPREERAELELEPAAVVVGAVDGEDAGARMARRDRRRLAARRGEHDRLEPGRGGGRGDRVAEVAGRRAAERRDAVVERGGDGDRWRRGPCRSASGSRPRASDADRCRAARTGARRDERRPARAVLDARAGRQERVVAPERGGPAPRSPRGVTSRADAVPVVGDVGRAVAAAAGVERLRRRHLFAHAAAQGERRSSSPCPRPLVWNLTGRTGVSG